MLIRVGVSGRHVHLSPEDMAKMFGEGFTLTWDKELSLAGAYIAKERVTLKGPKGEIPDVALVSSLRERTQVEISRTDCHTLGIDAPVRLSGDFSGAPGIIMVTNGKEYFIPECVIVPNRHIHMSVEDAKNLGFQYRDSAIVVVGGERSLVFDYVLVRVAEINDHTEIHIDFDEANAAGLKNGDMVQIFRINDKKVRLEQIINTFDEDQMEALTKCIWQVVGNEKNAARKNFLSELVNAIERHHNE
ncbi:MAG: phosphate propanoyltransferase [Bacillota bacterium]